MPKIVQDHRKVLDNLRYLKNLAKAAREWADDNSEESRKKLLELFTTEGNKYLTFRLEEAEKILDLSNEEEE